MQKVLIGLAVIIGCLAASPISDNYYCEDILVVVVDGKSPRHPFQNEYEQMLYPTVRITAGWSTGTGVIAATDCTDGHRWIQIITAAHVIGDESIVTIEFYDSTTITGTVVIKDTIKDIALIKAEINTDFKIYKAQLAPKNYEAYLFTPVWAVGCSLGLEPRPSQGIISAINLRAEGPRQSVSHIEITAPILPGNSGGPVYDARTYQVIGIAVWVKTYQGQLITTMAGIVPINQIHEFISTQIKQIQTDKSAQSAY